MAIKRTIEIFVDVIRNPKDAMYTYREIRLLRSLSHKNVVSLVDLFSPSIFDDPTKYANLRRGTPDYDRLFQNLGDLYLVFEFVDTDLLKLFEEGKSFTIEEVKSITYQMLLGLKHMHSANIIHRDIKPDNILIRRADNCVKIADFGLSRVLGVEFFHNDATSVVSPTSAASEEDDLLPPPAPIEPSLGPGLPGGLGPALGLIPALGSALGPLDDDDLPPPAPAQAAPMIRQVSEHVVTR